MKLIAFGDSFTHGLIKKPNRLTKEQSNQQSFIKNLEKNMPEFDKSKNCADCGASNLQIASTVYRELKKKSLPDLRNCFVFVGWTTFTRNSEWHNDFEQYRTYPKNKHKDSVEKLILDTESSMLFVENLLKKLEIPYCMIQAFHNHLEEKDFLVGQEQRIKNWINWSRPNNTLFDICAKRYLSDKKFADSTVYHAIRDTDTDLIAECKHPSKKGHIEIARVLEPYVRSIIDIYRN